jgi:hypothetical protein
MCNASYAWKTPLPVADIQNDMRSDKCTIIGNQYALPIIHPRAATSRMRAFELVSIG